ncbi:MAG: hypothetical protein EU530_01830 [Promethearchaeota archaeon]|nr:MAG: hypothetical protein EU530_01830 [Candidatus Lokiarchaeota archaeon]
MPFSFFKACTAQTRKFLMLIHPLLSKHEDYDPCDIHTTPAVTVRKIHHDVNKKMPTVDRLLKKLPISEVIPVRISRLNQNWRTPTDEIDTLESI